MSEKTSKLAELCRRFGVERLELFGSAATGAFDAASSDLDFIERGIHCTFKPVLDEGPGYRSRETMEDHRRQCEENLPDWLGYRRVTDEEWEAMVGEAKSKTEE